MSSQWPSPGRPGLASPAVGGGGPVVWATPSHTRRERGAAVPEALAPWRAWLQLIWWMPWWTDRVLRREAGTES